MACRAVESWTVSSLVGAYLDLALAYLFLLGATFAFFASKILSVFGLAVPCSCDGLFGHPFCAQVGLLVDFPVARIAAVHRAVRARFPFRDPLMSIGMASSHRCRYAVRFPSNDEDSCCSVASASLRSRSLSLPAPPPAEIAGEGSLNLRRRGLSDVEMHRSASGERISVGSYGATALATGEEEGDDGDQLAMIMNLERKLEEEKGARAVLYVDLENERSAAASAADEALAMIVRLQKDKAEIEMEARQYQRMVEEKSSYDEEEKKILKEIIVRREREKHVLEKKVEMYKQILDSGEKVEQELDGYQNFSEENMDSLVDSSDNPILVLREIYKSIGKKEVGNGFGIESSPMLNSNQVYLDLGIDSQTSVNLRKKSLLTADQKSQEVSVLHSFNVHSDPECPEDIENLNSDVTGERGNVIKLRDPSSGLCRVDSDVDQRGSQSSQNETESSVHDVHVIDDGQAFLVEGNGKEIEVSNVKEASSAKSDEMEVNIRRSSSEITNRIGMKDNNLSDRASYIDLRRSSMSSFDIERRRLEDEVELLKTRLEVIRQGRGKLSFSSESKDKETIHSHSLDAFACQLKEIKKITEPAISSCQFPFLIHYPR
ncbi:hypothetical protein AXF42_Ash018433 [Apostasia shenzhenica]|uniref:GTD-binding domain-containing protein n=1 Tax=Apostasia shenzhenica TaxID=1088818 RepID=A0A2I0BEB5_9ASPA|nr:hypothetical protein AXF42_Ash018433 [Apostasia shenzhenica]